MSVALAPQSSNLPAVFEAAENEERIKPFLPPNVSYARVVAAAQLAAMKTPALHQCTPQSIVMSIAKILQWGLEIGETAHLVPFGRECTPIADYKGLAQLMIESGAVRHVDARCVYANEFFEQVQGSDARITHQPLSDAKARGALIGAYCILRLPFQQVVFDFMPIADIDAIRKAHSKQWGKGDCPAWYAKKTVVRQVAKLIPKGRKAGRALEVIEQDAQQEFGAVADEVDDDEIVAPSQPLRLEPSAPEAEPTMALEDALDFVIPRGKMKDHRVSELSHVQLQAALMWTVENDTQPEFQLALATVLDAREKEEAKAKQESEAEGESAAATDAPQDPSAGTPGTPTTSAPSAAPLSLGDEDPYPDGTDGLTPGQLKSKALELLNHPSMNDKFIAGTKQQLATGLSIHQLRDTVRTIEAMIASAPVKGKKGPHRIGDLPGDPA
jgi:recombination protein RecT